MCSKTTKGVQVAPRQYGSKILTQTKLSSEGSVNFRLVAPPVNFRRIPCANLKINVNTARLLVGKDVES
jgi:hypothetical protein